MTGLSEKMTMINTAPLVYCLVLNYNGDGYVTECVDSILNSDYPEFRVVVIDNGSKDNSLERLKQKFNNKIITIENRVNLGYSEGFNIGLRYAFCQQGADFCLVINNDTKIHNSAVKELVRTALAHPEAGFVTGKVYFYDRPGVLQTVGKKADSVRYSGGHIGNKEEDTGQYDTECERFLADDVFTLVSRPLYEKLGGYNPLFFLESEEYEWQLRAKKSGFKIIYTPLAKVWHRQSMSIGRDSALKAYYDARNPMLVLLLHTSAIFFRRYLWLHLRRDIIKGFFICLKQARPLAAAAKCRGFFSCIFWGIKNRRFTLAHFI